MLWSIFALSVGGVLSWAIPLVCAIVAAAFGLGLRLGGKESKKKDTQLPLQFKAVEESISNLEVHLLDVHKRVDGLSKEHGLFEKRIEDLWYWHKPGDMGFSWKNDPEMKTAIKELAEAAIEIKRTLGELKNQLF